MFLLPSPWPQINQQRIWKTTSPECQCSYWHPAQYFRFWWMSKRSTSRREEIFLPGWKNIESRKVFKPYVTAGLHWTIVTHERNKHLSGVNFHALSSFCVCFSFSWHSSISFVILWNTKLTAGSNSIDWSCALFCVCDCLNSWIWFWKRISHFTIICTKLISPS